MNFSYFMPTKLFVGEGVLEEYANIFDTFGKKAFIITGKNSAKKSGALDELLTILERQQIEYVIFDDVETNPSLETIEVAAFMGKEEDIEFVVGVGGGSALDAAKAIAVMIKNPELQAKTLITDKSLKSLPVLTIPTTSGTGSETTQYAILTDHKAQTKRNLGQEVFPAVSFLDWRYTKSLEHDQIVSTALDTLSHLIESYLSIKSNVFSKGIVEMGLRSWHKGLEDLLKGELSPTSRENFMLASALGGMAIANTGTSLPHGMGYYLTYYKQVPHGIANIVFYKAYLKQFVKQPLLNEVLNLLAFKSLEELIDTITPLYKLQLHITEQEIESWAKKMLSHHAKLANHPYKLSYEEIYQMFYDSLIG